MPLAKQFKLMTTSYNEKPPVLTAFKAAGLAVFSFISDEFVFSLS